MSKILKLSLVATLAVVFCAGSGFGATFKVDPNGTPGVDFADLTTAFATIAPYAGTHNIIVVADTVGGVPYADANLAMPGNIDSLIGEFDPVFSAPLGTDNFVDLTGTGPYISGFELDGYALGFWGTAGGATIENCIFLNGTNWGVMLFLGSGGCTVQNNCFVGGAVSPQAYDSDLNTWTNNYFSDYSLPGSYPLAGSPPGPGNADNNPAVLDNSVVAPAATFNLGEQFEVAIIWTVPGCMDPLDTTLLAAYEFDVNFNPLKLKYIGARYDMDFFGDSALYTPWDTSIAGKVKFAAADFMSPGFGTHNLAYVTFEALAANTTAGMWVTSQYLDENSNPLVVGTSTEVVGLVDNTDPIMVSVTENDPIGDDTYSAFYSPNLTMICSDDYNLLKVEYNWSDGSGWHQWYLATGTADTTTKTWSVAGWPEGDTTLTIRCMDVATNTSNELTYTLTIDHTGPVMDSMTVVDADGCADAGFTSDTAVVYTFYTADTDVDSMNLSRGAGWEGNIPYANPHTYYLPNTEATYGMYGKLTDKYGNEGPPIGPLALELDTTPPGTTQDFYLITACSGDKTADTAIGFDLTAYTSDAKYWAASESSGMTCNGAPWVVIPPFPHPGTFDIQSGDGWHYVYFTTKDEAGNMTTEQVDSVLLDTQGPDLTVFDVMDPNGFECAGGPTWDVDVHFAYDGAVTDVRWLRITVDGSCTGYINVSSYPNDTTVSWTVPVPCQDGIRDYEFVGTLCDDVCAGWAGSNDGASMTDSLYFDFSGVASVPAIDQFDYTTWNTTYSNEAIVWTEFTGASADIVEVKMAETMAQLDSVAWQAFTDTMDFTWNSPLEYTWKYVWAQFRDCGGNASAKGQAAGGIVFDFTNPVVDSVKINGGAILANDTNVTVTVYATDVYKGPVELSEDPLFAPANTTAYPSFGAGNFAFVLSAGDNGKLVYARMWDLAGNPSNDDQYGAIELDMTDPTGTVDIVSTNPLAAPEWTNTPACSIHVTWDPDVLQYAYRSPPGAGGWTYVLPAATPKPVTIPWILGWQKVEVVFQDSALNWGTSIIDSIYADGGTPGAPAWATGTPGGSMTLDWAPVPNAQYYVLRYNYGGDYPLYNVPNPPAPGATEGFFEANVYDTCYPFVGPHPDIYHVSIWTMNLAGTMSSAYNTDVLKNNYILGDFATDDTTMLPDDCIDFTLEFGALAACYGTATGHPNFNAYLDIAPTSDASPSGYPMPDGNNDFDDLIIFALNFADFHCTGAFRSVADRDWRTPKVVAGTRTIVAELPGHVEAGTEFTVPITASTVSDLVGYHLVFDYDQTALEVVSVEKGAVHESVERSFFYYDVTAPGIDISSVILGESSFDGDELARITFRTLVSGPVTFEDRLLDLRNWDNQRPEVDFNAAKGTEGLPTEYALSQNYPNPFNPTTNIMLSLPVASNYELVIYNITGQVVDRFSGHAEAGFETIVWDADRYASGIYLYRVEAGAFKATRKMVLLK